jgi:hypothetical protein
MKFKITPHRLRPKEIESIVEVARHWDQLYKKPFGQLIKHVAWLEQERAKLESELREHRQVKLGEQIVAAVTAPKWVSPKKPEPVYKSQAHRFYEMFKTLPDRYMEGVAKRAGMTLEQARELAESWAEK